jgi:hypothetical protein
MSYIRTQCVVHSKPSLPWLYKISLLMLYKAEVAVCFEIHTRHIVEPT